MENQFKVEKKRELVLLSGVSAVVKNLEGIHQSILTSQDTKKIEQGFTQVLVDCIVSIGDKTNITKKDVEQLLTFDIKKLLWEIRRVSNRDNDRFIFDYQFAANAGKKLKQRVDIEFDDTSFPATPARWVRDHMVELYKEANKINEELSPEEYKEAISGDLPVMYDSYEEMIVMEKERSFMLPECGIEVAWEIPNTKKENDVSRLVGKNLDANTLLQIRHVTYDFKKTDGSTTKTSVPFNKLCNIDIDDLRSDIMDCEGNIDSIVIIESDEDSTKHAQVDLLKTPAFFFASLAI